MEYKGMKWRKALGYYIVSKSYSKTIYLHRLVWEEAYGEIPEKMLVYHIDGDKLNNDLSNLELMSHIDHRRIHSGWLGDESGWTHKPCSRCKEMKPLDEFYKQKKGYQSMCKACNSKSCEEYDKRNIDATRKRKREYWRRKVAKEKASLHPVSNPD